MTFEEILAGGYPIKKINGDVVDTDVPEKQRIPIPKKQLPAKLVKATAEIVNSLRVESADRLHIVQQALRKSKDASDGAALRMKKPVLVEFSVQNVEDAVLHAKSWCKCSGFMFYILCNA